MHTHTHCTYVGAQCGVMHSLLNQSIAKFSLTAAEGLRGQNILFSIDIHVQRDLLKSLLIQLLRCSNESL